MSMPSFSKVNILNDFHRSLEDVVAGIVAEHSTPKEKAQKVNALVNGVKTALAPQLLQFSDKERTEPALVLQYCYTVASLEYRHKVWPYEYMTFSRRIGELWEAFCSTAWDFPKQTDVKRIAPPDFDKVRSALMKRLRNNVGKHEKREEILEDVNTFVNIVGEINMVEDEVFTVKGIPHVIDFKSGFGSNEKGNMLRLQTVGRAYRIWNNETRLLLLVRQDDNNNYLKVLRKSDLWSVYTGDAAYQQITEITGANMAQVRHDIINWESDLTPQFLQYLKNQPTDLTSYLAW